MLKRILVAFTILVFLFCEAAIASDRMQLGTRTSIVAGKTKIYDVDNQNEAVVWMPSMIMVSARDAAVTFRVFIDQNVNSIDNNQTIVLAKATTGGDIVRNLKVYVRMTVLDSQGVESEPTDGNKFITTDGTTDTNKVTVSWSSVSGAASYNIYASSDPGREAFVGNTSSLTLDITTVPVGSPVGIPTLPLVDIQVAASTSFVILVSGMTIAEKIEVFCLSAASARATINIPVEVVAVP